MATEWRVTQATGEAELQTMMNRIEPDPKDEWTLDRIIVTGMATTEGARAQFAIVEYRTYDEE